ncbi:MAG: bifunctional 4'-phosphopantothenoylcysteine decarboxylase/phosphopantothenoylcysteine synthetase, partial [Chloroflexi bacterium]|nr:bifunctional 4'-phosphopantothenoylcysteine decarboxylase/phosphopantothenoylcysteine synthetase [Chloroflexota bacterium]
GRQGFAIAQAAIDAGADVTLIAGIVSIAPPVGATLIDITHAHSLYEAVMAHARDSDALIMAAAVADFRPSETSDQKLKKSDDPLSLPLTQNPDILLALAQQAQRPQITVGFAAESQDVIENAQDKLARKKLDMIVANDITAPDAGFGVVTNRVHLITAEGVTSLPLLTKTEVAARIISWLTQRLTPNDH